MLLHGLWKVSEKHHDAFDALCREHLHDVVKERSFVELDHRLRPRIGQRPQAIASAAREDDGLSRARCGGAVHG